jgi:hypothetical protein
MARLRFYGPDTRSLAGTGSVVGLEASVEVVVVVRVHLDDVGRTPEIRVWADEDEDGTGPDKPVDQVLRQAPVDLSGDLGWTLAPVQAWVIDIHVEPVLV